MNTFKKVLIFGTLSMVIVSPLSAMQEQDKQQEQTKQPCTIKEIRYFCSEARTEFEKLLNSSVTEKEIDYKRLKVILSIPDEASDNLLSMLKIKTKRLQELNAADIKTAGKESLYYVLFDQLSNAIQQFIDDNNVKIKEFLSQEKPLSEDNNIFNAFFEKLKTEFDKHDSSSSLIPNLVSYCNLMLQNQEKKQASFDFSQFDDSQPTDSNENEHKSYCFVNTENKEKVIVISTNSNQQIFKKIAFYATQAPTIFLTCLSLNEEPDPAVLQIIATSAVFGLMSYAVIDLGLVAFNYLKRCLKNRNKNIHTNTENQV